MIPRSKPQQAEAVTREILQRHGVGAEVALVGQRGYFQDSMGVVGKNDRGIYDDAIFLISRHGYWAFNANTDPTKHFRKGLACLKQGLWIYKVGMHGLSKPRRPDGGTTYKPGYQYEALVQAASVTVVRDGVGEDHGRFGINIHRGGDGTTSSLGCQTIPPVQWPQFIETVKTELVMAGQKTIPYLLIERQG